MELEPWKEEAGLGIALLLIGGADKHIGGAITVDLQLIKSLYA